MKRFIPILTFVALAAVVNAQTPSKTAATTAPAAKTSAASTSNAKPATGSTVSPWIKLPPGVPHVAHGPLQTPATLHYEDIKVGTGVEGEAGKLWHLKYTGWRAADGLKFDAWDEHPMPEIGPDGKVVMGPDGKPKMKDPEPVPFQQGMGRVIPGFDIGLMGMKVGGKRRIFVPWQLGYATHAIPDRPDHPGIPAKSDLIFDVELVDLTDAPPPRAMVPPVRPAPGGPPHTGPSSAPGSAPTAPASAPPNSVAPPTSAAPPKPAAPASPPSSSPPSTPPPQSK